MTKQTIDGVPRRLLDRMHSCARGLEASEWAELRALLDAPVNPLSEIEVLRAAVKELEAMRDARVYAKLAQGEPVAWRNIATGHVTTSAVVVMDWDDEKEQVQSLYAEQPAPVAVVPDGYCIMPRQLTAENGAKALLLGEFKLLVTKECPECCELEEPVEGCSICDGEGEYGQKHTIPWDQIKFIYSKAVSGLAVNSEPAKSR